MTSGPIHAAAKGTAAKEAAAQGVAAGLIDEPLKAIYGERIEEERQRWLDLLAAAKQKWSMQDSVGVRFFRSPGRTEIGGNHTDHNHGQVLVGTLTVDIIALVRRRSDRHIVIEDETGTTVRVDMAQLDPQPEERGTSAALVRGIAFGMHAAGIPLCGFDAFTGTTLPAGKGLSSSAAFESLIVVILEALGSTEDGSAGNIPNGSAPTGDGFAVRSENIPSLSIIERGKIGQYAENRYFGKPCGLEDQLGSLCGGIAAIDFRDLQQISLENLRVDIASRDLQLAIVDCGESHDTLTEQYAAIAAEMHQIARALHRTVLREVSEEEFAASIAALRSECGDRAVLRALHYFDENRRVDAQRQALQRGDIAHFLALVAESGRSSWMLCQNCIIPGSTRAQGMALALALSAEFIRAEGLERQAACRVHGGGFAGAIQVYMPRFAVESYRKFINTALAREAFFPLSISAAGATEIAAWL